MAAEPEAESDPAILLKTNPFIYGRSIINPSFGYSTGLTGYTPGLTGYTTGLTGYTTGYNPYVSSFYRYKREAEAESDPAVLLKMNPFIYGRSIINPSFGYSTGLTGYTTGLTGYTTGYNPYVRSFYRYKREAEAESDPAVLLKMNPYLYSRSIINPSFGYSTGLTGYTPGLTGYTTGLTGYTTGYNPYVSSFYRYKREAEADPAWSTVYTDGVFHTNAVNLAKGIHTGYAKPFGSFYNSYTPSYSTLKYNFPGVYANPYIYG